jgi:hypothetical protein
MPPKTESEKLPLSKIKMIYFLWRRRFRGSITELSKHLGYKNDSFTNRNLHELMNEGFVIEKRTKDGIELRLTDEGVRRIHYFIMPHWLLVILFITSVTPLFWGIIGLVWNISISPTSMLGTGIMWFLLTLNLWWAFAKVEEQFWQFDKHLLSE